MSTQTTLKYRTNRDLFSNYHLDEHLPETEAWNEISDEELQTAYDEIKKLWDDQSQNVSQLNESQLERRFIRPMFEKLGIPFEVEESAGGTQRRPDYGFFETQEDVNDAFQRREEGDNFYKNAIAVADAKRWGRKLDTRGKKKRDYENPSHQIDQYLRFTSTTWGVLTNGQKWRLYYKPTSHKLDSYYEIDLPTVLETGDLEEFKYFYLFFRHEAFVPDASGDAFLDDVYEESNLFAQDLGEDLQDNIYDAIVELSEGFLQYPGNDLDEEKLSLIHDSSLIYLYRIIFILYAEAEGRDLLDTNNEIYESQYSLNQLKQEVAEELESGDPKYRDWQDNLHSQLDELFTLIDQGSKSQGIPKGDLYIPAYNGGLFRTDPDESGSKEAQFLANNTVGDEHLARVIELLTRSESSNGAGKIFVDYSSLDVRHLGSIYEGLLEYQLNIAEEPLALDDGEYVVADGDNEIVVERDDVYLTTDSGERKATGSYYTPEYIVEYIVEKTLSGTVDKIRKDVVMDEEYQDGGYADEFAKRIFDLKILDPAMGSGHFLTSVVDYLARAIITEQNREADEKGGGVIDDKHDINWARRKVAQRCIYGVDINPLATELAKVSLWLRTLAAEQPLAFLDHHLKTGNSLVGSDIQDVLVDDDQPDTDDGQLTLKQSFAHTRKQALDHVMDRFSDLLAIDNETLEDAKEMEEVYQSVQSDPLYQKLLAMANVHTASHFGLGIPSDANKRMAEALRSDSWDNIETQDWFRSAQTMADDERFFHWELEFPVAFYDIDGNRIEDAGFDAVIGNPPYVKIQNIPTAQKKYVEQRYEVAQERYDLYGLFTEMGYTITNNRLGFIIPNKFFESRAGKSLRTFLNQSKSVHSIVDFGQQQVFSTATIYTCLLFMSRGRESKEVRYKKIDDDPESGLKKEYGKSELGDGDDKWTLVGKKEQEIISAIEKTGTTFGELADDVYVGVQTSANDTFVLQDCEMEGEFISGYSRSLDKRVEIESDLTHRYVDGKDVSRYLPPNTDSRLIYPYDGEGHILSEEVLKRKYPKTYDYLLNDKADLAQRGGEDQVFESWYAHWCPRHPNRFEREKIVIGQIVKQGEVTYDSEGDLYYSNMVYSPNLPSDVDPYKLIGILNSTLVWYYIKNTSNVLRGGYYRYTKDYVEPIGIPIREIPDTILTKVSDLMEFRSQRERITLELFDYLGNYAEGPNLPDIGIFQPTESNILDETTEKYEKLQIERARTRRDGSTVTIDVTARYKPEEEDEYETDQWGYTETGFLEAFKLLDLSKKEAILVEEFVPVAVGEAGGFAGFRDNATKTNSLVDRLKEMVLPDIDDVVDDLERYIEVKGRAEELDEKIKKTDQLIDEIVYDLYDLTDEEVEIVESAVADD